MDRHRFTGHRDALTLVPATHRPFLHTALLEACQAKLTDDEAESSVDTTS